MNTEKILDQTKEKPISNLVFLKFDIESIKIDIDSSIRHEYDPDKLLELADSIKGNNNELLQPILISRLPENGKDKTFKYKVVAGRRRFLACRDILKLKKISAIVKDFDSFESEFKAQFAENEERENWTDFDYVKAIQILKDKNESISQSEIAIVFGKSINWVKKKQQHLATISEYPESATSNLSTSIISELRKLSKEERSRIIIELDKISKEGKYLPSIREIRKKVSSGKNFKEKPIKKKVIPIQKNLKPKSDPESLYNAWEESGKVSSKEERNIVIKFLRDRETSINSQLAVIKKKSNKLEKTLLNTTQDIYLLEEELLFLANNKSKKKK
ncbi:MAG: ParB N-terminal domain-containing protein [Leptospiraceae bacterium]|nr:ParB N-terminal domain-containing protein [Leptospiraceae bacterium]